MKRTQVAFLLLAGMATTGVAGAQSTGRLYDPMPPDDSAYLRIVQAGSGKPVDVLVDGKLRVRQLAARSPSAYLVVPAGKHVIQLQSGSTRGPKIDLTANGKAAYTVAFPSTAASAAGTVFLDRTSTNRLKAMLAVYHLAPAAGTVPGAPAVAPSIAISLNGGPATQTGQVATALQILALLTVLMTKARLEERMLLDQYAGYGAYAARVGRLVPGIGRMRS